MSAPQQQQFSGLPQAELAKLQGLLRTAVSADNDARPKAMAIVKDQFNKPDLRVPFVVGLTQLMRVSNDQQVRQIAAIFLRKKLPIGEPILYNELPDNVGEFVRREMLSALVSEKDSSVRKAIAFCVAELAYLLIDHDEWNEFIPFCGKLVGAPSSEHRYIVFLMLSNMFEDHIDCVKPFPKEVHAMFSVGLKDADANVRSMAFIAVCHYITHIEDEEPQAIYQKFIPDMLAILKDLIQRTMWEEAARALESLSEVATEFSLFFVPELTVFGQLMLTIAQDRNIDENVRKNAVDFVVKVCVDIAPIVRKNPNFLKSAVTAAAALMVCADDDPDWAKEIVRPDEFDDNSLAFVGELAIDHISEAIGEQKMKPLLIPLSATFLRHSDWKVRHAGVWLITQGGAVFKLSDLPVGVILGLAMKQDENPRVRGAALTCIAQFCLDHSDEFHEKFHQHTMQALLTVLNDPSSPRVQASAGAALFNFMDTAPTEESVKPYLDKIVPNLVDLMKKAHRIVQEQAITVIAAVASSAPKTFAKYYQDIMPLVKHIIIYATNKNDRLFRAKAIECATHIGDALGRDKFRGDAKELLSAFMSILKSDAMQADDEVLQYLLHSFSRLAAILKEEFLPYMPAVMEHVFRLAGQNVDYNFKQERDVLDEVQLRGDSETRNGSIEDKMSGVEMLTAILREMGPDFLPWIPETIKILLPLTSFMSHDDMRGYAISAMPDIIKCVIANVQKGKATFEDVKKAWLPIASKLIENVVTDNPEMSFTLILALTTMLGQIKGFSGQFLEQQILQKIGTCLLQVVQKMEKRMSHRESRLESEDIDDELAEKLMNKNEGDMELFFQVSNCSTALIEAVGANFLPVFKALSPNFIKMINADGDRFPRMGIYVFDDVVEHCGPGATAFFPEYIPLLLKHANNKSESVRQGAVYGLAVAAMHHTAAFRPYAKEAAVKLVKAIKYEPNEETKESDDYIEKDYFICRDNAAMALGAALVHCPDALDDAPALFQFWYTTCFPITDPLESTRIYGLVCAIIENKNAAGLGQNLSNLPRIVTLLLKVVGTEFATKELMPRIGKTFALLSQLLPREGLMALHKALTPDLQKRFETVLAQVSNPAAAQPNGHSPEKKQ